MVRPLNTQSVAALLLCLAPGLAAADDWTLSGDARGALLGAETRARDGTESQSDSWRARVRAGLRGPVADGWHFGTRLAARLDSRQGDESFELDWSAPSPSGLANGQATVDQFYLEFTPTGSRWQATAGRFQSAFAIDDVMKKSLDRNDSPSFDVSWTDGLWLRRVGDAWTTHLILQHNHRDGPTNTLRPPLSFLDGASRVGVYAGLQARNPVGPVVQRLVALTWLPAALRPFGPANPAQESYLAVTAKGAAAWPLGEGGTRLVLAAEAGFAPNTPRRTLMGSGSGDADGFAWQASANLTELRPSHSVGLLAARIDDGWLISPDFRPNSQVVELRWLWRLNAAWAFDARVRRQKDIDLPTGVAFARRDDDFFVRTTFRF